LSAIFTRESLPDHLSAIHELDFSGDLLAERFAGPWTRIGVWVQQTVRDEYGIEDDVLRESLLIPSDAFPQLFDKLDSVGNVLRGLGDPSGFVTDSGRRKEYRYAAFHQFNFPFSPVVGEPLVFLRENITVAGLFINPDLWLQLELEERTAGNGIWWSPRRGVDILVQRVIQGRLHSVDIRTDFLLRYLQTRQMSLLVGHYRQLLLFRPSARAEQTFETGEVTIGAPASGAKAYLQNWGLKQDSAARGKYLQRRLHLWFEIQAPAIDIENPWHEAPTFDAYAFTLPTAAGPVAPARWKHLHSTQGRDFDGNVCDFMDHVYFRQEVLTKYEVSSGYDVRDDGSVANIGYWGLTRSTSRIGNELLSTAIGDFAEGVPFEEWPHWKGYSVDPPSPDSLRSILQESPIPKAVNSLVGTLNRLNATFAEMADAFAVKISEPLWRGSLDSLAGHQLKWVYPATAGDDEFIKRATLASTLFLEGLQSSSLRQFLIAAGKNLHGSFENPGKTLGSRKLLQRTTLVGALIETLQPKWEELPSLVEIAEGKSAGQVDADLQSELKALHARIHDEFSPLAFLYDLRTHGGLAHPPNKDEAATAAGKLGLPKGNWHRTDYLALLKLVGGSFARIGAYFEAASHTLDETP
jgi:hypothetical protein